MKPDSKSLKLKVLYLEDSPRDVVLLQTVLEDTYDVCMIPVMNESEYISALAEGGFDIILSDYSLPSYDAFKALHKAKETCPNIPFICVSGTIGEDTAVELLKQGAIDYVLKDRLGRLGFAIDRALGDIKEKAAREQAEKALLESQNLLISIANSSPALIWLADKKGSCTWVNEPWTKFTGTTLEQNVGNGWKNYFHPEDIDSCLTATNKAYGNRQVFSIETRIRRYDGEYCWIVDQGQPFYDASGTFAGYIGSCLEITNQKHAQEALIQAKEKAEESDRLKSSFLANMSHEIRTPMNGILGFSSLLATNNLDKETMVNYKGVIQKSCDQLLNIITNILDISLIESNQVTVKKSPVDITKLLSNIHSVYLPLSEKKNIQLIKNEIPGQINTLVTDEIKLSKVLSNLIDNAIKFTHRGHVEFGLRNKGSNLEFYVKDTGIGIPGECQRVIFERFRQVEEEHTKNYGGNGLGLSISKAFVKAMGGRLWLKSEPGKGSTFYFTIPVKQGSEIPVNDNDTDQQPVKDYSHLQFLIAEDEEYNYQLIEEILKQTGVALIRAKNGREAVDICNKNSAIDLVLMDIRMPGMDGIEATKQIKASQNIPVIAITAYATDSDKEKFFNAGCDDYLAKPIQFTKLFTSINRTLWTDTSRLYQLDVEQ